MKASVLYRVAAVLLLLFAAGHTMGFIQPPDPQWRVDALLASMRSIHFDAMGSNRTYWDFYVGSGLTIVVLYLFAAVLAWQLGGLPAETLSRLRGIGWASALCFAAIAVVSWRYIFIVPIAFSLVIAACLATAAWLSKPQVLVDTP
jgi:hypothetical protein